MKYLFIADDGQQFETKEECLHYEETQAEKKRAALEKKRKEQEEKAKRDEAKKNRQKELHEAYERWQELSNQYYDDFPEEFRLNYPLSDLLFNLLR